MIASNNPLYFIKLETTGLNAAGDDIVGIICYEAKFTNGELVKTAQYKQLVKSEKLTPRISKINGITDELLDEKGISLEDALLGLNNFWGKNVNIVSFTISKFIGPFLSAAFNKTGIKADITNTLDLYQMSRSLCFVSKYSDFYGHKKLAQKLSVSNLDVVEGFIEMFNIMYKKVPAGDFKDFTNFVKNVKSWNFDDVSYLYIDTKYGTVRLNLNSTFFEEDTPGFFDMIDMDAFTKYLCQKKNACSINDFIKIYL